MSTFALADLFELVVDAVGDREALVCRGDGGDGRWTYADLADRAGRCSNVLAESGAGTGDRVALHLRNGEPFVSMLLGTMGLRAVPVNLNTRYTAEEVAEVVGDAGCSVVVTEADLAGVVADAIVGLEAAPAVLVADGALGLRLDEAAPAPRRERSSDDLLLLYTGGTTGRPKGVMWRSEDLYQGALGGRGVPSKGVPPTLEPIDVVARATGHDPIRRRLPLCPLIHGGALWITLQALLSGGTAVISTDRHLDAVAALDLIADEQVELIMVIGDATARPLADALDAHPDRWDLSALQVVASGGAVLSPVVARAIEQAASDVRVLDTFGASETGSQGRLVRDASSTSAHDEPMARNGIVPRLLSDADTAVVDEALRPVEPGRVGRLARRGNVPLGYWNDPERSAATFPVIDGERWSVPGDMARLEADGTITVLGRGSASINTGGEKVFPEEVESVLKAHPSVFDVIVVGVPDERLGQQVAAVVAPRDGVTVDVGQLGAHCREHLAGYKVPRRWTVVDRCRRLATGKPDHRWAQEAATS
jgi:acyl-CoA synthetase (AMP-forming)/AMP-acid ligase II